MMGKALHTNLIPGGRPDNSATAGAPPSASSRRGGLAHGWAVRRTAAVLAAVLAVGVLGNEPLSAQVPPASLPTAAQQGFPLPAANSAVPATSATPSSVTAPGSGFVPAAGVQPVANPFASPIATPAGTNTPPPVSTAVYAGQAVGPIAPSSGTQGSWANTPPASNSPEGLPPLPLDPPVASQVNAVMDDVLGMTPDQIRGLRRFLDERQKAASELPNPPESVTSTIHASLSPGMLPPVIRTYQGSISSFVVVDATGAPWPVENFQVGSALFVVSRLDEAKGSTFAIQTMGMYGQSNLVLKLEGIPTPAVITLMAGQDKLDSRVEVRVQGRGPRAIITSALLPEGADGRLLSVLDGVPPEGGSRLRVSGAAQVSAWMMPDQTMIVRTPMRILKPATLQFVSSSDGTYVYVFPPTPRLLGMSAGVFVDIGVSGW